MTKKQIEKLTAVLEIAIDSGNPERVSETLKNIDKFLNDAYDLFLFDTYAEKEKTFKQITASGIEYMNKKAA